MAQEIKIERDSFGLTIYGVRHSVKKPNLDLLKEFTGKQKEAEKGNDSDGDAIENTKVFLSKLGIPADVCGGLDPEMLEEIVKIVTGQKKS